ncbi:hypothetical protein [Ottowia thiooxydans]|uniref:hypothetical protein n=1 Tax=Ottowia thiooxydans TaxID=219182 RepID=UPI00041ECFAB|nr:hypothetical protein [Ottowia thiooxydans]
MRKFFLGFLALLLSLGLASCGGGGGYDGNPTPTNALRMSPLLSNVTLSVGYVAEVAVISQGVKPYHVLSSDASVSAMLLDDDTLVMWGNTIGTSTVAIQDSGVQQKSLSLTVTVKATPLATSVGSSLSLESGESSTFTVTGGVAPYTVESNNNSIARVTSQNNGVVTVSGQSGGSAVLLITDAIGSTLQMAVTVTAPEFNISPSPATGVVGTSLVLSITGGTAPYTTAISSNPSIASATINGSTLNVSLLSAGASTVTVRDARNQTASVAVTATAAATVAMSVSPPSGSGQVGTNMILLVSGGIGPYSVVSSNPTIVGASANGNRVTASFLSAGASTLTVVDSIGSYVAVSLTSTQTIPSLSVNPPSASGRVGSSMGLTIIGGVAPYEVASSNPSVASVSTTGNSIFASFNAAGTANVTVVDSGGQAVTVALTATLNTTTLASNPTTATDAVGRSVVFTLSGGTAPYTAVSSNPQRSTVSVNGSTVTVNLTAAGASSITMRDAQGQVVIVTVTATAAAGGASWIQPPNQAIPQNSTASLSYALTGVGPFVASLASSDAAIASANISGNTLTIGVGTSGRRCIGTGTRLVQVVVTNNATGETATATQTIVGGAAACP